MRLWLNIGVVVVGWIVDEWVGVVYVLGMGLCSGGVDTNINNDDLQSPCYKAYRRVRGQRQVSDAAGLGSYLLQVLDSSVVPAPVGVDVNDVHRGLRRFSSGHQPQSLYLIVLNLSPTATNGRAYI